MSAYQIRILVIAVFFLLILASGFLLTRSGKPYSGLLLNAHKLIAIAAAIYAGINIHNINQSNPLEPLHWVVIALLTLFVLVTVATGGLASIDKSMPIIVTKLHHIGPYMVILSSASYFFLTYT